LLQDATRKPLHRWERRLRHGEDAVIEQAPCLWSQSRLTGSKKIEGLV